MSTRILIRGARQLLTLQGPAEPRRGAGMGDLGTIPDGAVLVREGRIEEVGPSRRIEALAQARRADEIDATGKVVMPGLVDAHTHLVSGPARVSECTGAVSPEAFWRPLQRTSRHTMEAQARHALEDFARHGTTTLDATSGFGIDESSEIKILRTHRAMNRRTAMVVSSFMGTRWAPPNSSTDDYIARMCSGMLPLVKKLRLAEFADICCEHDVFSREQARRYMTAAARLGFVPRIHAGQRSGMGGVLEAVLSGAASVNHAALVSEAEIDALVGASTVATLLPATVFSSGQGKSPDARRMIDKGVAVALGTNYNAETCPLLSMQLVIALACRMMHMSVAEAISAATINAAHALLRGGSVGSLQPNKFADLIILDISDYRELACHPGMNLVEITMKAGKVICRRAQVRWGEAQAIEDSEDAR